MGRFDYGKILQLDLTAGYYSTRSVTEKEVMTYLGGRGLNAKLLYDLTKGQEDPLSPENPMIFGNGLLTGSATPCSG